MSAKTYLVDGQANLVKIVQNGGTLGKTFHSMFEPKDEAQIFKKRLEKKMKSKGGPKKKDKVSKMEKFDILREVSLLESDFADQMLETHRPPNLHIHPNPSSFHIFAEIRQSVLERKAKEAINFIRKQQMKKSGDEEDTESEEEEEAKIKEPPVKIPKIVGMGLSSVFELIRETRKPYPDLCQRSLQALLDVLQGQTPEGMKHEPTDVIDTMYSLLMDLATSPTSNKKEEPLSALACSCLLSLVIAVGDTSKILRAVSAMLMSTPAYAVQAIKVPGIMASLNKSVQAVLLGKTQITEWSTQGIKRNSRAITMASTEGIKDISETHSAITSDGQFVYVHNVNGLFKIGTGYGGTIKGHAYIRRKNFYNKEKGWLGFVKGTLFFRSLEKPSAPLTAIDILTLKDGRVYKLQEDGFGPQVMFTDGEIIGHVTASKDDTFVIRCFNPTKFPMPIISEMSLKLSQKCMDWCGSATYENNKELHTIHSGCNEDIVIVVGSKDYALGKTATGKLLYTGKPASLGVKVGGPAPGKWAELSLPKGSKVSQMSTGHDGQHAVIVTDSGEAYFIGTPKRGEDADASLSKGRRQLKSSKPKKMTKMDGKKVISSACNASTTALVTDDGELYMFGKDTTYCDSNGLVTDLKDVKVTQVGLGKSHTVVLTDEGRIYTFGINNKGQCGRDYQGPGNREMNVPMFEAERYKDDEDEGLKECPPGMHNWKHDQCLVCTVCHECTGYGSACVSSGNQERHPGMPCGCGSGDSGCIDCGICKRCAGEFRDADVGDPAMLMEYLSSRGDIFRKGDMPPLEMLMSMGKGSPRHLEMLTRHMDEKRIMEEKRMRRNRESKPKLPRHVPEPVPEYEDPKATATGPAEVILGSGKDKASQIMCGLHHTVVVMETGDCYVFGNSQYGQLGFGDTAIKGTPTKLETGHHIVQAACGAYHTALLTSQGQVVSFGTHLHGELGRFIPERWENEKKTIPVQSAGPDLIPGLGPNCGRRASWIGSSNSQTYIRVDESIITPSNLTKSSVFANHNIIGVVPQEHLNVRCLLISRQDGSCKSFTGEDQASLTNCSLCMDPMYDTLWGYDTVKGEINCYNVTESEIMTSTQDLAITQSPFLAIPVRANCEDTRSHSALYLLGALDTLTRAQDLNLAIEQEEKEKTQPKGYTKEDFLVVHRFESHGGGWGYSGHSVEAIRFSVDTDCLLGGLGMFGGRGEYNGKIKLFELGPEGGDNEGDGVVVVETEEITYECSPREKFAILFDEPFLIQANNWYVAWAKVSGPSSDCGSSGMSVVTTDDQIIFKFKSSKKSNNGTDTNAGQIPQIFYKLPTPDMTSCNQNETFEPAHILSKEFSRTVASESFESLLQLLNWSWSTFNEATRDIRELGGTTLLAFSLELQRLVYICKASLHLLTSFICEVYTMSGNTKSQPPETSRIAECVCETRSVVHRILAEHKASPPGKSSISQGLKEHNRLADSILQECHRTFTACFHAFYPTGNLKWLCLCDLLHSTSKQDEDLGGCGQQLAAVMDALSHPSVKLTAIMPINSEHGKEDFLRQHFSKDDNKSSAEVHQFPVLVEQMLIRTEMEGGSTMDYSFKEILDRLLHIVTLPVKQLIRKETITYPDNLVSNTAALLSSIIQELSATATWSESDISSASRPIMTTPNRFTRTSPNAHWNAGDGSPDAILFTVDKPGIVIAGACIYGGTGSYNYVLELLDDRGDDNSKDSVHTQHWTSLETAKGTFSTEDCIHNIVELKFARPVPVKEGIKYALRLRNQGAKTYNGDGGIGQVKCADGTTFTFTACSLSTNGTTNTRGQIPHILFYSAPDGDNDEENCRMMVEYQSRRNAVSIASSVIRSATDLLIRAQTHLDDAKILEKLGQAHMFSSLLPMVLAYIGPVASQDPRSAIQVLTLIQQILQPVANLNTNIIPTLPTNRRPSFSLSDLGNESGSGNTTSQYFAIVESDHPYKPATVTNHKVTFPNSVKWMTVEFDPQCATCQNEDCLWLYVPVKQSLQKQPTIAPSTQGVGPEELKTQWKILRKFSGAFNWPVMTVIIPGNEVTFSLETSSDYAKNDKASFYGFKCTVLGYEWTAKTNEGILLLEKELAYLGAMCSSAVIRRDMNLPAVTADEMDEDLELIDEGAEKILKEHHNLLSKGIALSESPTVTQALEGTLPFSGPSNEKCFLQDFIACKTSTTGGRLARWLQPESFVDPKQCDLEYSREELKCNWPCAITVHTRDQYGSLVSSPSIKVEVKAIPVEQKEGFLDGSPKSSRSDGANGSVLFGGHAPPCTDEPFRVTVRDAKDYFHCITAMKRYENYSFEELRYASPIIHRPSENMIVRSNHDGTLTASWTPSSAGHYELRVNIDGFDIGRIYKVEVKDAPLGVAPPSQGQVTKKPLHQPSKLRKFIAKYSAGLRIRVGPSLQVEQIGLIKPEGVIEFIEEIHNDDGVWLRLSPESSKEWCSNGYTEAWCLQYNQVLGKTLLVPVEEPKSIMDEMVKETKKKKLPELVPQLGKMSKDQPRYHHQIRLISCGERLVLNQFFQELPLQAKVHLQDQGHPRQVRLWCIGRAHQSGSLPPQLHPNMVLPLEM